MLPCPLGSTGRCPAETCAVAERRALTERACSQTDPEAAKVVFGCGAALTMVPLEVTHTALATPAVMQRITPRGGSSSAFLALMHRLLLFFAHTYRDVFDFAHPPLHDPLAVFYVACPSAFKVVMQPSAPCATALLGLCAYACKADGL